MKITNTLVPYKILEYGGIQYSVCRDFNHVSRYRKLRRVVHNPDSQEDRFISLEVPNAFSTTIDVRYYVVPEYLKDRLDVIAYEQLGDPNYAWVISYINKIEDGYTARPGQKLMIPRSITDLFSKNELLSSVSPSALNLGSE